MSHSFNKIWIHAIWSTKERLPLIQSTVENKIYQFISEQLREQGCPVRIINGMPDHIHCLFLLNPQKSIAEVVKQIKANTQTKIATQLSSYRSIDMIYLILVLLQPCFNESIITYP